MWKTIKNLFTRKPMDIYIPEPSKSYRKKSDTTKLTKGIYDFVIEMKAAQEEHNDFYGRKGDHQYETTEELCAYLNMVFGTNFSRSKLSRIWQGKVNKKDLPVGITYTIPF